MKPYFIPFIAFLFLSLVSESIKAQAWSVLHPAKDTLHYASEENFILSFTTDSIKNAASARIIFPRREFEIDSVRPAFLTEIGHVQGESWLGGRIIETSQSIIFIYHGDSLILPLQSSSAQSDIGGLTLTITNGGTSFASLPTGGADSLITFTIISSDTTDDKGNCLNNSQILLSKNHGLIYYPACFKVYVAGGLSLLGDPERYARIKGVHQTNFDFPTAERFFDYSPGDVLQYFFWSNTNGRSSSGHIKFTILEKKLNPANQVNYEVKVYKSISSSATGTIVTEDTVTWSLHGNSFEHSFIPSIFHPMLSGSAVTSANSFSGKLTVSTGYWYQNAASIFSPDSLTYFREQKQWVSDSSDGSFEFFGYNPYPITSAAYLEGIGLTGSDIDFWLGSHQHVKLEYYSIKGVTWGQNADFGISENALPKFRLYPNPATHSLYIERDEPSMPSSEWSIADLQGRVLMSGDLTDKRTDIKVEALSRGIYFLQVDHQSGMRFIKE